jgi:hypothetical protein
MFAFAEAERMHIPGLNQTLQGQVKSMCEVAQAFRFAQARLEGDEFGTGGGFVGRLFSNAASAMS